MSDIINKFEFDPVQGFENTVSFPDPTNEAEVREQLMRLHNQLKSYVNQLAVILNEDTTKLNGIETGANKYVHPEYETVEEVIGGKGFTQLEPGDYFNVVDSVQTENGHVTFLGLDRYRLPSNLATTSQAGLMSTSDKTKLDSFAEANTYATKEDLEAASVKLEPTGVNPGMYGGFDSSVPAYNIASVEVDETGRVVNASNSVLPQASNENDGYITAADYTKLANIPYLTCQQLRINAGDVNMGSYNYFSMYNVPPGEIPVIRLFGKSTLANDIDFNVYPVFYRLKASYSSKNDTYYFYVYPYVLEPLEEDIYVYIYSNYQPSAYGM